MNADNQINNTLAAAQAIAQAAVNENITAINQYVEAQSFVVGGHVPIEETVRNNRRPITAVFPQVKVRKQYRRRYIRNLTVIKPPHPMTVHTGGILVPSSAGLSPSSPVLAPRTLDTPWAPYKSGKKPPVVSDSDDYTDESEEVEEPEEEDEITKRLDAHLSDSEDDDDHTPVV